MKLSLNWPLVVAIVSWGFNFVAIKILYTQFPPPALALLRYLGTASMLLAFSLWRRENLRPKKEDFWPIQWAGFIAMGLYMILFLKGLEGTTPAEGAIMLATSPIFSYLLSCAKGHERFDSGAMMGSLLAFLGVSLVILGGAAAGHGSFTSNLIVLASSVVWSFSAVMMKPLLSKYGPLPLFTMSMPGAAIPMLAYGGYSLLHTDFSRVNLVGWSMFAFVSIVSGCIAFVCFYRGIRDIGVSRASFYQYFVPPLAALFAWLVMGKALAPLQYVGFVVVLGGVVLSGRARAVAARAELAKATA